MDITSVLIVLAAGFAGGFTNAVSAAGSLFTLPAFMFAGLTPAEANATNRIAILAQNFSSTLTFRQNGIAHDPYVFWLSAATVPGAMLGAWFSLQISDELFTKILSVVMVMFLIITITNPLKYKQQHHERTDLKYKLLGAVVYFFIGVYGGFIQAGTGFFLMAGCMLIHRFDILKTNYFKSVIMLIYTLAALAVFLWKGHVLWLHGLLMAAAMGAGAYVGVKWSIRAEEVWIKRVIVLLIIAMAAYLWFGK
ncbi:MAG: sulfite exporter TauE/SafE family protein [Chitinophagales bacterium]|nr:sulfite exporter TauE/SafE family protein [Chitinophagales bacterium]MDW8418106.1 sulfite exporter TauE/SafE family protein [Chitinophagales bacterium]